MQQIFPPQVGNRKSMLSTLFVALVLLESPHKPMADALNVQMVVTTGY